MDSIYLCIVALLIVLAVFDLVVGVSNDAVNFLSSAIGAKVARFRTIMTVAAVGVLLGAAMSNGMMDVARHGIMTPKYFSFYDVICVFTAVMATDVILLDVFNTLGMPTSTTVSMVFELLGGAFAIALMRIIRGDVDVDGTLLRLSDLLNTEKAMSLILGIFLSVAIAFFIGALVQWLARLVFTFGSRGRGTLKKGVLAGISVTAIIWFLLINGLKGSSLMTPGAMEAINGHAWQIICGGIVAFSVIMTLLSMLGVNVLKAVVLLGTMALAMAFASNDLVNFIGIPLTGLESFRDFMAGGGAGAKSFMMGSLMESAHTPWIYLLAAGAIMVLSLVFSRKARNVVRTSVDLSRQDEGDEMFGSSAAARQIVRSFHGTHAFVSSLVPRGVSRWIDTRFDTGTSDAAPRDGAAFDEVRATINLVLASLLVALGTSLKLPLSTTYVTFMVAMGSSLADHAWSRESAVYRITGVLSVIGGWFITAGAAFILCYLLTNVLHLGGVAAMLLAAVLVVVLLVRRNSRAKDAGEESVDAFSRLMRSRDPAECWRLLKEHVSGMCVAQLSFVAERYGTAVDAFFHEEYRPLKHAASDIEDRQKQFKRERRRGALGLRRISPMLAVERNTWYYLTVNALSQALHSLERLVEPCRDHVGNNFSPVPGEFAAPFKSYREELLGIIGRCAEMLAKGDMGAAAGIRQDADRLRQSLSQYRKRIIDHMQLAESNLEPMSVLLNMVQETQELISGIRHAARGANLFMA